jgi:hypothetical protein
VRAQGDHRAVRRVDEGLRGLHGVALAVDAVALGIGRGEVGHGVPAANVAPGGGKGDDGHVGGLFP